MNLLCLEECVLGKGLFRHEEINGLMLYILQLLHSVASFNDFSQLNVTTDEQNVTNFQLLSTIFSYYLTTRS